MAIRYSSYAMIFAAVLISIGFGDSNLLGLVGPLFLLGAAGGAVSLHLAWAATFRLLYGMVTVMAALWVQMETGTPFFVGWAVLMLGLTSTLLGGVSLETRYLATTVNDPGQSAIGLVALKRTMLRMGTFMLIVTVAALLAVLGSFVFALGTFPIWAVGISTAVLVLMLAYLVSKSAEAADQSG